jgi:hypothetical protein
MFALGVLSMGSYRQRWVGALVYAAISATSLAQTLPAAPKSGESLSVKDYGAKGDGVTDDTAAVNAAAAAVPGKGGSLAFPPGQYAIAGTAGSITYGTTYVGVRIHSNTAVKCDHATLLGIGPNVDNLNLLVNAGFQYGTVISDSNITVDGCDFSLPHTSGAAVVFWFARHVSAINNTVHGGGDGIATVGVLDAIISANRVFGNGNAAFDNFWGSSRLRIINNYAEPLAAPEGPNGNSWGIQLTNTDISNKDVAVDDILIEGNTIRYPGVALNTGAPIGIDGTVTGLVTNLTITYNDLYNTGTNSGNPNIFLISGGSGWTVSDNILDGAKIYPAIFGLSGNQSDAIITNNTLSNCAHTLPTYTGNIMMNGKHNTVVNNRQLRSCTGTMVSLGGDKNLVLGNDDGSKVAARGSAVQVK